LSIDRFFVPFGQLRPAFDRQGKTVLTTGPTTVQVWNPESGNLVDELPGHDSFGICRRGQPRRSLSAATGINHTVRVWPLEGSRTSKVVCEYQYGIRGISLSPDGSKLATACDVGDAFAAIGYGNQYT